MVFENKISWNTVITVTLFLFGGVGVLRQTALH